MELEYKYVVCNQDGNPSQWKPGSNYSLTIPAPPGAEGEVAVMDAWDGSIHEVELVGMHDVHVVGLDADGHEVALTEEQEIAAVRSLVRGARAGGAACAVPGASGAGDCCAARVGTCGARRAQPGGPGLSLQASKAVAEVLSNMEASVELQQQLGDPAAPELLLRDRQVAASVSKLVGRAAAAWPRAGTRPSVLPARAAPARPPTQHPAHLTLCRRAALLPAARPEPRAQGRSPCRGSQAAGAFGGQGLSAARGARPGAGSRSRAGRSRREAGVRPAQGPAPAPAPRSRGARARRRGRTHNAARGGFLGPRPNDRLRAPAARRTTGGQGLCRMLVRHRLMPEQVRSSLRQTSHPALYHIAFPLYWSDPRASRPMSSWSIL
jgi:hypothetical protein